MITLAFYKDDSRWLDKIIQLATGGPYSHVEMIAGPAEVDECHLCLSSSWRDGGVRSKYIRLRSEAWDVVQLPVPAECTSFIETRLGLKYDVAGVLLSRVCPLDIFGPNRWFCSEIIAAALGMSRYHAISPNGLYDIVTYDP
ncbi:hypothetical protein [Marivivens aquimaris]|uniref:hypothetical protein n=1 Tax=Marivivens aquimaris TaxID=2774876 RepID=UPI00187FF437|nr:hypothetical protein [Marivivens aquimaris]